MRLIPRLVLAPEIAIPMREERHERRRNEKRAEFARSAGLADDQIQALTKIVEDFNEDLRKALAEVLMSGHAPVEESVVERAFESLRAANQAAAERLQRLSPGSVEGDIMAFLGYQMDWPSVEQLAAFHKL
jgi:hypothetical protein